MKLILIRHGKTKGNYEKRYIGKTDESLSVYGIEELETILQNYNLKKIKDDNYVLYSSPLKRCIETCHILFENKEINIEYQLREIDFGDFENKNYKELCDNIEYQKWIDSNAKLPFPNGESREDFVRRCCAGFETIINDIRRTNNNEIMNDNEIQDIVMVVHGGTIMAIMDYYEQSDKKYFDYQCENGSGYICDIIFDTASGVTDKSIKLRIIKKLL